MPITGEYVVWNEQNIDAIEEQDWTEVCSLWFSSSFATQGDDEQQFNEFIKVLSNVGINFFEESQKARTKFIKDTLFEYLKDAADELVWGSQTYVFKIDLVDALASRLGFSTQELIDMLDEHAKQLNLVIHDDAYLLSE